ncbi:hypothetical protein [Hallella colorans]|uniref:hypothetical protein n=1 Tax=Hallella colorans TaxID=1703337 RepID=UPI001057719B|nr:hypothetical protein [Hallella colorans]
MVTDLGGKIITPRVRPTSLSFSPAWSDARQIIQLAVWPESERVMGWLRLSPTTITTCIQ